jgi:hypothetical protein
MICPVVVMPTRMTPFATTTDPLALEMVHRAASCHLTSEARDPVCPSSIGHWSSSVSEAADRVHPVPERIIERVD